MIVTGLLLLGAKIASEPINRITSVQINYKRVGNGNSATATVFGRSIKNRRVKQVIQLDTFPGGAGNSKPIILDHGQVAIFTRHEMSRFNVIVGLKVENHRLRVDEEFNEKLFAEIPPKVRAMAGLLPNNVQIGRSSKRIVRINFVNRDEKDGVKTTFRVKNLRWTCVSATSWRDADWDGIHRF